MDHKTLCVLLAYESDAIGGGQASHALGGMDWSKIKYLRHAAITEGMRYAEEARDASSVPLAQT